MGVIYHLTQWPFSLCRLGSCTGLRSAWLLLSKKQGSEHRKWMRHRDGDNVPSTVIKQASADFGHLTMTSNIVMPISNLTVPRITPNDQCNNDKYNKIDTGDE